MPRTWFSWTDSVLLGSNKIDIVSQMTVPGLRHAKQLVEAVRERLGDGPQPQVIINRFEQKLFSSWACAGPTSSRCSAISFAACVPNNYSLVREAIDRGVPLDEVKPGNQITSQLRKLILPQPSAKSGAGPGAGIAKKLKLSWARAGERARTRERGMAGRFTLRRAAPGAGSAEEPSTAPEGVSWTVLPEPAPEPAAQTANVNMLQSDKLLDAKVRLHRRLIEEINLQALERLPEDQIRAHVQQLVTQYILVERLALNQQELNDFVSEILDEMTGLGPLEPLLKDDTIADILINGHECVYVERRGVLEPCGVRFKDEAHLLRIINKIVAAVGRRVDELHPRATRACSTARASTSPFARSASMAHWSRSASSPRSPSA